MNLLLLNQFSILLCGFTVFSALTLIVAYTAFLPQQRKTALGKLFCCLLLICFVALQWFHKNYFLGLTEPLVEPVYLYVLLFSPSLFFCFSRTVLFIDLKWTAIDVLHLCPLILGFLLPIQVVPVYSFVVGTGYTLWLIFKLYELRLERRRFKFEMFFFTTFALMAFAALVLGLSMPYIPASYFYLMFSNSIGLSFVLVITALIIFPQIVDDVIDAVESTYARSKLDGIDIEAKLAMLDQLMIDDKVFLEESLDLARLSDMVNLTTHQLSELINTRFAMGSPKYVRQLRVQEAKRILIEQPEASVLSVSLETGFRSQSSFYTAFHEFTGQSPGSYRQHLSSKKCE